MREFNTSGPCNPALHYTVLRETLLAEGMEKVQKGQFFTLFAPRQSGKTTYFQLLLERLNAQNFTPIWISLEHTTSLSKARFYASLTYDLQRKFSVQGIEMKQVIKDALGLSELFAELETEPIVLVIDEFEGIPDSVLSEVMHTFRKIYHEKSHYRLQSLILVGVSTLADLVLSTASPFNIADEISLGYFTQAEVEDLISQYVAETGQRFSPKVIQKIYNNTKGQPDLVCALCSYIVTQMAQDKNQPVTMADFRLTLQYFLTRKLDKNIINIVQKARQRKEFMLKLLFDDRPLPFNVDVPDIAWLYAHGVIEEADGQVVMNVPLYAKRLINAFAPLINGETDYYVTSPHDNFHQYLTTDGGLDLNALLIAYRTYVQRRGGQAFDTETLKEAACHYSLDSFINFFITQLGGQTYIEVPSGKGRVDILIRYQTFTYVIEVKRFSNLSNFKRGKGQLVAYLKSEGLQAGYYVVFSQVHTEADTLYSEETLEGVQIYTHIILLNFLAPSQLPVPEGLQENRK